MTIKVGDPLPTAKFKHLTDDGLAEISSDELFGKGKSILFAVPGAFTPTCSNQHLPGFVANMEAIRAKGVERVACLSVNDPFVMKAWGERDGSPDVAMVSDWDGAFTKALGLDTDASPAGLGLRSKRFAMVIENGIVAKLSVEEERGLNVSAAEAILDDL
jgi:glutaredoxin/glutathione-dependent peroxiredoxin